MIKHTLILISLYASLFIASNAFCAKPIIDEKMASYILELKETDGYDSENFNACQITSTVSELPRTNTSFQKTFHEVTFFYENNEIIRLTTKKDDNPESIQGLGLNCLEFNDYVYLFFDTLNETTQSKFNLTDLAYVTYSRDKGRSWSQLQSLHSFSEKAKFVLPQNKFLQNVKIFGNNRNHVLSIYNMKDETTYLFDPNFNVLKTVPVYNRLSDFDHPTDFHFYKDTIYLTRGSCEQKKGRISCPRLSYLETSNDFGKTWKKERFAFIEKSYFLTIKNELYHFYHTPCKTTWFGVVPAFDQTYSCGNLEAQKLATNDKWEKPKTFIKSIKKILGFYREEKPIFVWQDFRFHRNRPCGFLPIIGCIDSTPVKGPLAIFSGELDTKNLSLNESLIEYQK